MSADTGEATAKLRLIVNATDTLFVIEIDCNNVAFDHFEDEIENKAFFDSILPFLDFVIIRFQRDWLGTDMSR